MITDLPKETAEQGNRDGETMPPTIRTMRRRVDWRIEPPVFVRPLDVRPYNLTEHAAACPPGCNRVLIVGHAPTKSQLQTVTRDARRVYAEGRYPTVTTHAGVQVGYASQWFGESPYTPDDALWMWTWLQAALQTAWRDDGVRLLMTPATTGRDLWVRTVDRHGYPVMSDEARRIVQSTAGQGRMEVVRPGAAEPIRALWEYDARMAYVSLMESLPIGEPEHHCGQSASLWATEHPYNEGRYSVRWKAPSDWRHPGILPAHTDPGSANGWHWPLTGEGWCSGVELFTARMAGWRVEVLDGYVWPIHARPLRTWRDRLLRILADAQSLGETRRTMARAAVRALILHSVGAFHGSPHRISETGAEPPADAQGIRLVAPDVFAWWRHEPPKWPQMVHPEWSATIWGRARARLVSGHRGNTGFMTVDPSRIVAFRTDAVYLTEPVGWEGYDDGTTPGRYRVRSFTFAEPQPWPVNGHDVLRLRERAA